MAFNPFFFNDSPLPMELIYKALKELEYLNPTVEQLKTKVDKLVADLDGAVKEEVQHVIDEMYESGEFLEIIGSVISNSLVGKSGDIDLYHMGYVLHKAHSYCRSALPTTPIDVDEEFYSYPQGNCVFMRPNGDKFWAVAYISQNGSSYDSNNVARIYVYKIHPDYSLSYVTDKIYAAVGHCNSLAYLDGYIYVSPTAYDGSGGGNTFDILRVSFDGESLGGTDIGDNNYTMERKTPTGWAFTTNNFADFISGYNGKLYVSDAQSNIYTYDWNTNVVTLLYNNINGVRRIRADGMSVTDNFIYFSDVDYRIKRYNINLGIVDWTIQLPIVANNKTFKLGEVEGITVLDGVLFVLGGYNLCGTAIEYSSLSITRFYCQNLATNDMTPLNVLNWTNGSRMPQCNMYVAGDLPNDTDNPTNNFGFTEDTAFSCAQLALDILESCQYMQRATIIIKQYRNTLPLTVKTVKPVIFTGEAYWKAHSQDTHASIGHVHIYANASVVFDYLEFNNILPDINNEYQERNCILHKGGTLTIRGCNFPPGILTNTSRVRFAIESNYGLANIRTSGGTSASNWTTYRAEAGVSNPEYLHCYVGISNIDGTVAGH